MLTHECKGNASYKHLSIKQENIDLYYKNKPRIFATVPAFDTKFGNSPLAIDQELQYVSYYIEKGNYWKIDNITLGYTFNFNTWIKRLRIYGTVSNLATITGYSGIDPEVSLSGLTPGVDNKNRYPSTRTYTFGVSIKF